MLAGIDVANKASKLHDRAHTPRDFRYKALQQEVAEVLRLAPDPARGAKIFSQCAGCHAAPTKSLPEGWVPDISGQHPRYLAKQLIDYRHSVRWDPRMEPVARGHGLRGTQDIADVVAYVSAQPQNRLTCSGQPTLATQSVGFYSSYCRSCHGSAGGGDNSRYVPRIGGQDFAYLLRQIHDVVDGRRPNMRKQHFKDLETLDVFQMVSLSCYISHLGEEAKEPSASELITLNLQWSTDGLTELFTL
jgi:cytochrome c553